MRMKRIDLGQTIGILANLGVLVSIAFLAYEMRQNTTAIREEALEARSNAELTRELAMATDTDLQALYIKSLYSPQEMTLEEVWGISSFLSYRMVLLKRAYDSYQDGVIQKDDWDDRARSVPVYLGNDFGRVFWVSLKPDYANSPGFVNAIDEALATSPVVPDDEWLMDLQRSAQGLSR